jgi:L-fuconolactonase
MNRLIDAHHHFWDPRATDYPWLNGDFAGIRRRFGPEDLVPNLVAAGVAGTILVQTRSGLDETRTFLEVAAGTPLIRGVVGWLDLTDAAVSDTIAELRAGPGGERLVGIRHQVHDEADPEWLLRPDVERGIAAVGRAGLVFDLLVRSRELPAAIDLARRLADVRFVVDHLAKPPIAEGRRQPWAGLLAELGPLHNVTAKLSGLVTEAHWTSWTTADLQPYVDVALEIFGPTRILFGSDWPVCLLAAPYADVLEAARTLTGHLSQSERIAIFGRTAEEIYGLVGPWPTDGNPRPDEAVQTVERSLP